MAIWLLLPTVVWADGPTAGQVQLIQSLNSRSQEIQKVLNSGEALQNPETLKQLSQLSHEGLALVENFRNVLMGQIPHALNIIHGSQAPKLMEFDSLFPYAIDEKTNSLMRGFVQAGNPAPVLDVFGCSVLQIYLVHKWLLFAHGEAVAQGQTKLPYGDYKQIRIQLDHVISAAHRLFPDLPAYPLTKQTAKGIELDRVKIDPIVKFLARTDRPTDEELGPVMQLLAMMHQSIEATLGYISYYPEMANEEQLLAMQRYVSDLPGFYDCANYSRGLSDLIAEPCRPKEFRQALTTLVQGLRQYKGNELLAFILATLVEFQEQQLNREDPFSEAEWNRLEIALPRDLLSSALPADIKKVEILQPMVSELVGLLKKEDPALDGGLKTPRLVKSTLEKHGISFGGGFDGDYAPLAAAAEETLKKLDGQLRIAKESDRDGKMPEQFERLDAGLDSCAVIESHNREKSPWVLNTVYNALSEPLAATTTEGGKQLIWLREVKAARAVDIQDESDTRSRKLGALAAHTALNLIIPNIVQTRLLLGMSVGDNLQSIEVREGKLVRLFPYLEAYHFFDWSAVIASSRDAFDSTMGEFAIQSKTSDSPDGLRLAYIKQFRAKTLEAAQYLQSLETSIRQIKTNFAVIGDAPVSNVLQIPKEMSGEVRHRQPGNELNHSLVKKFLPTLIREYVVAYRFPKEPRATQEERIKQLEKTFSVDQMRDILDWYLFGPAHQPGKLTRGGELPPKHFQLPGEPTGGAVCGVEELKLLYRQPLIMARLLEHTKDLHDRKLEYLEYARNKLRFLFPALRLNEAWENYTDGNFDFVMKAYLDNAVEEANRVYDLEYLPRNEGTWIRWADTTMDELIKFWKEPTDVLGHFMPLRGIMELVLRAHPDMKFAHCGELRLMNFTESATDAAMLAADGAGIIAAYVSPMSPVGFGIAVGAAYFEGGRAYRRASELDRAERTMLAGASQLDYLSTQLNSAYVREMQEAYAKQLAKFALSVAAVGATGMKSLPAIKKLPAMLARGSVKIVGGTTKSIARGWQMATEAEKASTWFQKIPNGLRQTLSIFDRSRKAMMQPLVDLRIAEQITARDIMSRLAPHLSLRGAPRLAYTAVGETAEIVTSFPFNMVGYRVGSNRIGQLIGAYFLKEGFVFVEAGILEARGYALGSAMNNLAIQHPIVYNEYLEAMYNNEFPSYVFPTIAQLDRDMGAPFREQCEQIGSSFEGGDAGKAKNFYETLDLMKKEQERELSEERSKPEMDIARVRVLMSNLQTVNSILNRTTFSRRSR